MKSFEVENFKYNGFFIDHQPGKASYTAKFNSWTNDPGVLLADCSDGKQRLIPSCCLIGCKEEDLPVRPKQTTLFGKPSRS